ncbi:MAG: arsenic resistance protein [Nitriliruptorales bacterium]|nr:arsenic resistance protein [Nitriliruptorales bacterium]
MSRVERWQPVLVLASALVGLAVGALTALGPAAEAVVLPALMILLVGVFLQITAHRVRDAARRVRVVTASLVVNFVWTPLLAWLLGALLLGSEPDLRVGLLMLLVTPCTDWYLVFTGLARGNVALATALLPINLVLQLVLLPVYVLALAGTLVPVDAGVLIEAVVLVLLIPLTIAGVLRALAGRSMGLDWLEHEVASRLGGITLGLLCLAVAAVFAAHGDALLERPGVAVLLLPALALFFVVAFLLARGISGPLGLSYAERVTLTMTTLARNSPLALAIAVAAFPDRPLIAVALVVGPLVELPVLALAAQLLRDRAPTDR